MEYSLSTMEHEKTGTGTYVVHLATGAVVYHTNPTGADDPSPEPGKRKARRKADHVASGGSPIPRRPPHRLPFPLPHPSSSPHSPPSSFHRHQRAKLAMAPDQQQRPPTRPRSTTGGSGSSTASPRKHTRQLSHAASYASSLPFSALVVPHAPSVACSAGGTAYHMRDPRKPPRVQPTGWGLALGGGGSGAHAWLFFAGFMLFPLWWVAGLCVPVPRTRRLRTGTEGEPEKAAGTSAVVLDDPQVEFDARSWRTRCRVMAGVSLATYVPFIVLIAVFVPRQA
ncbi:hypothetical protein FB451DRAFT_1488229 [Mycena latifolia]|nr:hypothetical protein FB451DRAFT_1488229 [Mycena latifolia]